LPVKAGMALVYCAIYNCTYKTDGFVRQARRKAQQYPVVSQAFATQYGGQRHGFMCSYGWRSTLVLHSAKRVTNEIDGFVRQARRKPERYPVVSRGFATRHDGPQFHAILLVNGVPGNRRAAREQDKKGTRTMLFDAPLAILCHSPENMALRNFIG
jgi:uncharacterized protein YcgL (UPF0745 family)